MKYRRLGMWGVKVSEIGFGSWLTIKAGGQEKADALHRAAYERGINFFDTANVYGRGETEPMVGKALRPFRRDTFVLATKCYFPFEEKWPFPGVNDRGLSRKHIMEQCDASLKRLGTDYIDLYQCHRFDAESPLAETCRAMSDLIDRGKVLYWGVSQWTAAQIAEAVDLCREHGWHGPASNQPLYNMLQRGWEQDVFPMCAKLGLGIVCFSPLAEGVLANKYASAIASAEVAPAGTRAADPKTFPFIKDVLTPANVAIVARLAEVAKGLGVPMSALALAWCLRRPELSSAIIGASRLEQIEENVKACDVSLDADVMERINAILGR
jgi:aryl-alcohol dehydrogenase-like predicted oxidoreductase